MLPRNGECPCRVPSRRKAGHSPDFGNFPAGLSLPLVLPCVIGWICEQDADVSEHKTIRRKFIFIMIFLWTCQKKFAVFQAVIENTSPEHRFSAVIIFNFRFAAEFL